MAPWRTWHDVMSPPIPAIPSGLSKFVAGTCCWAAHSLSGRGGCLACHLPLKKRWSLDKLAGHCHDSY